MDDNKRDSKVLGRRRTLQMFGIGVGAATGLIALSACNNDKPAGGGGTPAPAGEGAKTCESTPDETSKGQRRTLQYKKVAAVPEKHCSACAQYTAGQYGDCGGCKLFTGPVQPEGGCLSFAPKGAEAGVASPPG